MAYIRLNSIAQEKIRANLKLKNLELVALEANSRVISTHLQNRQERRSPFPTPANKLVQVEQQAIYEETREKHDLCGISLTEEELDIIVREELSWLCQHSHLPRFRNVIEEKKAKIRYLEWMGLTLNTHYQEPGLILIEKLNSQLEDLKDNEEFMKTLYRIKECYMDLHLDEYSWKVRH